MGIMTPENLGPVAALFVAGGWVAIRVLDRMTNAKANRSQTEDTLSQGQMNLTLTLARQNENGQERLARIQDTMIKEQQNYQETMHRLTNEITNTALMITKAINQLEILTTRQVNSETRLIDWDARMNLFMEHQKLQDTVQSQMFAHIKAVISLLNMLVTLLTPKDVVPNSTKEKDLS